MTEDAERSKRSPVDPDDTALARLFDETAGLPERVVLTRLAARALDIPERAARVPRVLPRWAWGPTLAGMFVAIGAVSALLFSLPRAAEEIPRGVGSLVSSGVPSAAPLPVAPFSELSAVEASDDELADTGSAFGFDDESGGEAVFDLDAPASDQDLDAWLAFARELGSEG
jgi:hypothetical protein